MKKLISYFAILICFVVMSLPFVGVRSASAETILQDDASIFSESEEDVLKAKCDDIEKKYHISVYIWTDTKISGSMDYERMMEDYVMEHGSGDVCILMIGMCPGDRIYEVQGYGKCQEMIPNRRATKILDHMEDNMRSGNYYNATYRYCNDVEEYMGRKPMLDNLAFSPIVQFPVCLLLVSIILISIVHSFGMKMTVNDKTYLDEKDSGVIGQFERYTHTTTSRRAKPKDSGGSGGGGGGGHSSGGGRSF